MTTKPPSCSIFLVDPDKRWRAFAEKSLAKGGVNNFTFVDFSDVTSVAKSNREVMKIIFLDMDYAEQDHAPIKALATLEHVYLIALYSVDISLHKMSRIFKLGFYDCVEKPFDANSVVDLANTYIQEICPLVKTKTLNRIAHNHFSSILV